MFAAIDGEERNVGRGRDPFVSRHHSVQVVTLNDTLDGERELGIELGIMKRGDSSVNTDGDGEHAESFDVLPRIGNDTSRRRNADGPTVNARSMTRSNLEDRRSVTTSGRRLSD